MTKEFRRYRVDVLGSGYECLRFFMVTARTPGDAIEKAMWKMKAMDIDFTGYSFEAMER